MSNWINSHGIEVLVIFYIFSGLVSTMPPLPDTSSYWAKWAFGFLHVLAAGWEKAMESFKGAPMAAPAANETVTKTEIKKTVIENKTEETQ